MNALFSFDLFYGLYTRMLTTAKNYEITHADTAHFNSGDMVLILHVIFIPRLSELNG
jgi:ribosomal protein S17